MKLNLPDHTDCAHPLVPTPPEQRATNKQTRVLVVEDQRSTSVMLVRFLTQRGYWVESCMDVETALARMDQGGFDLLLADLHLPDGDAWGLLTELTMRGKRPPRVVSMSASDPVEARIQSRAFGCSGHLVNPFVASDLMKLMN